MQYSTATPFFLHTANNLKEKLLDTEELMIMTESKNSFSLYDIDNIDEIFNNPDLNFDVFFKNHFPFLATRHASEVIEPEDIPAVISEATLLAKLEIELINYTATSKIQDKMAFIDAFRKSAIYQNYYAAGNIVNKTTETVQMKLGTEFRGIVDNMMYGMNKLSHSNDFNSLHENVQRNIKHLQKRLNKTECENGNLYINLKTIQNNPTSKKNMMLSILASNPKNLGFLLATVDDRSQETNKKTFHDLVLKGEKTQSAEMRDWLLKQLYLIMFAAAFGAFIGGMIGMSAETGGITGAAAAGSFTYVGLGYAPPIEQKLWKSAADVSQASVQQESSDITKDIAKTFNENAVAIHHDTEIHGYIEYLMSLRGIQNEMHNHEDGLHVMRFLRQQTQKQHSIWE